MKYIIRQIVLAAVTVIMMSSCTKDDLSSCYTPYSLTIQVSVAPEQSDRQPVQSAVLYVFDTHTGTLLGQHMVSKQDIDNRKEIILDYKNNNELTVVCWGNTGNMLAPITNTGTLNDLKITLQSANGIAASPNDLFFGTTRIDQKADTRTQPYAVRELSIERIVSSIVIKTKHLKEWMGTTSNDFHYVVRQTQSVLDFNGLISGPLVGYIPQGIFNDVTKDFITNVFNVLPSTDGNVIEVDIYHGNTLVYTLSKDENNHPIKAVRDRLLNIVIDFGARMEVNVNLTPWGDIDQSIIM